MCFLICSFTEMVFTFAGWNLKMHLSFVEGKKKIGLENIDICLYNENRKINGICCLRKALKAGLITGLDVERICYNGARYNENTLR